MAQEDYQNSMILLEDSSILEYGAPRLDDSTGTFSRGKTKLVEPLNALDSIDEVVGPYKVIASAFKSVIDLVRRSQYSQIGLGNEELKDYEPGIGERSVLFDGSITIYKKGKIQGTELEGFTLKKIGRIWFAQPSDPEALSHNGLRNIILGHQDSLNKKTERIEKIIRGYEHRELLLGGRTSGR